MAEQTTSSSSTRDDHPAHRYSATLAATIEAKWQDRWEERGTFEAPNPSGLLSEGIDQVHGADKLFVLDMFPYPSGVGLHVGHPLGYIGTDVYARYQRMCGRNVLHAMGYDAFGLPAEQYAVQTGTHPRVTTEQNVANMRRQMRSLGLGHDPRRSVLTTDPSYYRWTQWIFLQIFNSWYDTDAHRARPITELIAELDAGSRQPGPGTSAGNRPWAELDESERRAVVNEHRLAYLHEAPVNWCPGLGTVLANEEVTADGRSERGNYPVYRRPMKQWMLRITAYADRLVDDLDLLDWSESIKLMQRNWIGRSTGAQVAFPVEVGPPIEVFTTRPDTLFGATYMVLAPEHSAIDSLIAAAWADDVDPRWTGGAADPAAAVRAYQEQTSRRSDLDRQTEGRDKTGVFTGSHATNPVTGQPVPVFVADYVLMGYGTGAIMAVPAHDQRDFEFAQAFGLPVVEVVTPSKAWVDQHGIAAGTPAGQWPEAFVGDGVAVNSHNDDVSIDGLRVEEAKAQITSWLESAGIGHGTVQYKLRDWLFSRQRYWGEPFPIVYGDDGLPQAVPEAELPVLLPEIDDFSPRTSDREDSEPEPPLGRVEGWATVTLDLGDGPRPYRRELNTMPQWAGSCWYELRYLDPTNEQAFVDADVERYWMGPQSEGDCGGVDLYVGGAEHAVLHLLYARFWHKVLFDLGHVSSCEPFRRLYNQGMVQAWAFTDERGVYVEASEVTGADGTWTHDGKPVTREYGKMGKSLKNAVTPDEMFERYGADTLRLYEMFTGPLDQSRPWDTTAVVGMYRQLQRIWRLLVDEDTGEVHVSDDEPDVETQRIVHRTIAAVRDGMETLRFNTSIARITELTNHLTARDQGGPVARGAAEPLVLLLAPLAPHIAEELWERLGHPDSLARTPFPVADAALLVDDTIELPVQVNGKVRGHIEVATDADEQALEAAARADAKVAAALDGATVRKVIVVPGRMVNFVVG